MERMVERCSDLLTPVASSPTVEAMTADPLALAAALLNRDGDLTREALAAEAAQAGYDDVRVTGNDVDLVASVLPSHRRVFGAAEAEAVDVLNGLLRLAPVRPRLVVRKGDAPALSMHGDDETFGVVYLSDFSLAAASLAAAGQVDRLRRCAATGCQVVFVDRSRAAARRYCDMRTCGNRMNVAAYRERQRTTTKPTRSR
jgi:predicted RNA-binding Zn ribbon-like protein